MSDFKLRSATLPYRVIKSLVRSYFRIVYRWRYVGYENIPKTGAVVLACNHIHNADPFLAGGPTRRFVNFMAKEQLFRFKPLGALMLYLGAFPVRRGAGDKKALKTALDITKHGGVLMIFPEGHRSKTGQLGPGQPGVAFIARKAQCPIVPMAVIGPYGIGHRLTVRVGKPFFPKEDDTNETLLETLMSQIQALLDEEHLN